MVVVVVVVVVVVLPGQQAAGVPRPCFRRRHHRYLLLLLLLPLPLLIPLLLIIMHQQLTKLRVCRCGKAVGALGSQVDMCRVAFTTWKWSKLLSEQGLSGSLPSTRMNSFFKKGRCVCVCVCCVLCLCCVCVVCCVCVCVCVFRVFYSGVNVRALLITCALLYTNYISFFVVLTFDRN